MPRLDVPTKEGRSQADCALGCREMQAP